MSSTGKSDVTGDPVAQNLKRRLGGYVRRGNHAAAAEVRRELAVHNLAAHIQDVVSSTPPPRPEDIAFLGRFLFGGAQAVDRAS